MEQIIWGHPFGSGLDCSFYYELDTPGLKTEKRVQEKAVLPNFIFSSFWEYSLTARLSDENLQKMPANNQFM